LADFRNRAGLPPSNISETPYESENLLKGLEILSQPAGISLISFCRQGLPSGWEAYVGSEDSLLNPDGVCQSIVGCQIVDGLGHNLSDFFADNTN
jgi:hypothetical protein